jgi:hypothetical protein
VHTDLESAMAFAAWAGGRLPFSQELFLAREEGAIELDLDQGPGGEYLLDVAPFETGTKQQYLSYTANGTLKMVIDEGVPTPDAETREGPFGPVGFRLVFPTDTPEIYRALVAEPLEDSAALPTPK